MSWSAFDSGKSIGTLGSESGVIVRDEEHSDGARITLERNAKVAPFAITCGVYGWLVHTRFFGIEQKAQAEFDLMSAELGKILLMIPVTSGPEVDAKSRSVTDAISKFVKRFP
jgi:hypothetical protein